MKSPLARTFRGQTFEASALQFLDSSFVKNFERAFREEQGSACFLVCYESRRRQEWSRRDFKQKVDHEIEELKKTDAEIHLIVGGNRIETLVRIVASLVLGRAVLPINPAEGASRLEQHLKNIESYSVLVLVDSSLDESWARFRQYKRAALVREPRYAQKPFILIPTSGTTGVSKLVIQLESSVMSNVDALIESHEFQKPRVLATALPVFHVNALEFSFFCALFSEAKLVLFESFDLGNLADSFKRDQIQILSTIPSQIRLFLQRWDSFEQSDLQSLKYLVSAAAPLSRDLVSAVWEKGMQIRQGYGLSEAVNFSALLPPNLDAKAYEHWMLRYEHPSIGAALRGNEILIVDDHGKTMGPDQPGEVALRGWNVMPCYWGQVEENSHPEGFFRTGDLGLYRNREGEDPFYFIVGRKKDMVKRAGESISLRDLDEQIQRLLPEGVDAVSVPFENDFVGEEIGLVFAISAEAKLDQMELKRRINCEILPFFRPRIGVLVQEPIRTASGKPRRWIFKARFSSCKERPLRPQFEWLFPREAQDPVSN